MNLEKNKVVIYDYLNKLAFLNEGENITDIEVPGDGNMNLTLRVKTDERSFIIKQSRDYVEKYPQVAAPADRCLREAEFYALISPIAVLSDKTPKIWHVDKEHNILIMEDFGHAQDFSFLYHKDGTIPDSDLKEIMEFAATLHSTMKSGTAEYLITNRSMRKLNHEHIYVYPFITDNGFDLDNVCNGLKKVALAYQTDDHLKATMAELGQKYLSDGKVLLHGDYFPGSWLKSKDGIKIIDPEFCYFGEPEFEIGVTLAHLIFAKQNDIGIEKALAYYTAISPLNREEVMCNAGVEIMRRIMGLAQLPINLDLQQRSLLLERAYSFIIK